VDTRIKLGLECGLGRKLGLECGLGRKTRFRVDYRTKLGLEWIIEEN